jgi:hypothetical protein
MRLVTWPKTVVFKPAAQASASNAVLIVIFIGE